MVVMTSNKKNKVEVLKWFINYKIRFVGLRIFNDEGQVLQTLKYFNTPENNKMVADKYKELTGKILDFKDIKMVD